MLRLLVGIRFQVYFTPLIGVLFTFPSRYLFTIGQLGVLSLGGWSPHVQTEFHVFRLTQGLFSFLRIQDYHLLWCDFPDTSAYYTLATGLVPVRSPLLREYQLISFPTVTEMFHFTAFASYTYVFSIRYQQAGGFPHSEIFGSKVIRTSPKLIAAYHVFHRLLSPRHPLHALLILAI